MQPSRYGNDETEVSRWFQQMAKPALQKFAPPEWFENFGTYQGIYVVGADGTCYDYKIVWNLSKQKFLEALAEARKKYADNPPGRVAVSDDSITAAEPAGPEPSTSVLRVFSRIRPLPEGCHELNRGIGRDHIWIFEDELRELIRAAEQAGEEPFPLPRRITGRLVRFHLLDVVRNTSQSFAENDVRQADFTARVVASGADRTRFALAGHYDSEGAVEGNGQPFGMRGWLRGEFEVDHIQSRITDFRAYGEATAFGQTQTEAPTGKYAVVFALVRADDDVARSVPPLYHAISPVWRPIYRNPSLP